MLHGPFWSLISKICIQFSCLLYNLWEMNKTFFKNNFGHGGSTSRYSDFNQNVSYSICNHVVPTPFETERQMDRQMQKGFHRLILWPNSKATMWVNKWFCWRKIPQVFSPSLHINCAFSLSLKHRSYSAGCFTFWDYGINDIADLFWSCMHTNSPFVSTWSIELMVGSKS